MCDFKPTERTSWHLNPITLSPSWWKYDTNLWKIVLDKYIIFSSFCELSAPLSVLHIAFFISNFYKIKGCKCVVIDRWCQEAHKKLCLESLPRTMIISPVEIINCKTGMNSKERQTTALCNKLNCQSLKAPVISSCFPKLLNYRLNFIYQPAVCEKGLIKFIPVLQ